MIATIINTNKSTLSITYNNFDDSITGELSLIVSLVDVGTDPNNNWDIFYSSEPFFLFTPAFVTINPNSLTGKTVNIDINDVSFNLAVGDYAFDLVFTNANAEDKIVTINLKVINDATYIPPVIVSNIFKLKYFIQRDNYRLDIFTFVSPNSGVIPKEINGTVEFNFQDRKDLYDPIIASSLRLNLEASSDLTFEDLYTEEEKQFKVVLTANNIVQFIGFIKPDGIIEDYVYNYYKLEISCINGLSTLKNISFSNENGIIYSGKRSVLSVIYDCLAKTSLNLPININCQIYYEGLTLQPNTFINTFSNIIINTERYFQNADEPMDCESVLKSILTIFNATIIQMNGEWWIFRVVDLKTNMTFSRVVDGIVTGLVNYTPDITIGSQIDGFSIFHANKNQKKSISPSVQAYKISYQYGPANSVFRNPELKLSGSGLDIDGWLVNTGPDGQVYRNESGYGLNSKTQPFPLNNVPVMLSLNQTIDIQVGATFNLSINFSNESSGFFDSYGLRFAVRVGNQWLNEDGSWTTTGASIYIANSDGKFIDTVNGPVPVFTGKGNANYTATIKAPMSGLLGIFIFRDTSPTGYAGVQPGNFRINSIFLTGTNNGDIKGIDYTAQRTQKASTVTKSNITVYNGDSTSDLFVGTIYKNDADTPTSVWFRQDKPLERKELLSINAEDNLRISPRPMFVFEGDLFGFIPYLSVLSINKFTGKKFLFTKYSYSFDTNITQMSAREFETAYMNPNEFRVDVRFNYGSETKVTISGS